jgi:N-acetylmuramoyl-L-alanine amidase CwlA
MKQYNIDISHVIMHHGVTGKQCPIMWTQNEKNLSGWYDFLARVNNGDVKINIKENNNSTSTISSG